jgi:hypothetical protein
VDYRRLGALTRLKDAMHPAAARRIIAAMVGAGREDRARAAPALDPVASPTPSRPAAGRLGLPAADTPQAIRRRRAFQFAAGAGSRQV